MLATATWMLATTLSLTTTLGTVLPRQIDVDCTTEHGLERALAVAAKLGAADIYLHGVCIGNFVIATDGVTLRAGTPGSGLAAPAGEGSAVAVLEIIDAQASVRGLSIQGATYGVFVHGPDAEVLLFEVDVHDQSEGVGVFAGEGSRVRLIDTTVRDGYNGIAAQPRANINLQNVVVSNFQRTGISVFDGSFAALNDTTVENCGETGLDVGARSDVNILGGVFRENGQIHILARDWSSITLITPMTIGSETDATSFALGTNRDGAIASFNTPVIHGNVVASDRGSIRLGNTVLHGDLIVLDFSDAIVRDSEITGSVSCVDGSDAICHQTTTGGASGCPSPTCGSAPPEAAGLAPSTPERPAVELRRFEDLQRSRPGR